MMILQHKWNIENRMMTSPQFSASVTSSPPRSRSPDMHIKEEDIKSERDSEDCGMDTEYNDCVPLDLSVNRLSPGIRERERDSGTESDDSGGRCTPEGVDCKAYKKSLMKRYCKFPFLTFFFFSGLKINYKCI